MYYHRVACFDHQGHLQELEEFLVAEEAWACFADKRGHHPRVQLDKVDDGGMVVLHLASVGFENAKPKTV